MKEITAQANALAALGHEARLSIFRLLVRAGEDGLRVGDISAAIGMPASTLAHHLSALLQAGLIEQSKKGREVWSRANYAQMHALVDFLTSECCLGVTVAQHDAA
ncbi:MAG: metalloregulator ArsR/SmtB family transcription factor [Pseudomonadota bacterium]